MIKNILILSAIIISFASVSSIYAGGVSGTCSFAIPVSGLNLSSPQATPLLDDSTINTSKPKLLMTFPQGVTAGSSQVGKNVICIHGMPHNILNKKTKVINGKAFVVFNLKVDNHNKSVKCK